MKNGKERNRRKGKYKRWKMGKKVEKYWQPLKRKEEDEQEGRDGKGNRKKKKTKEEDIIYIY